MKTIELFFVYFLVINLFAIIITIIDKQNAKHKRRRVPEDFLLTIGLLGGALFEYITMKIILHKTKHKKFMIGLPIEILLQIAAVILIFIYK